jgi:hypothetical protein
MAPALRLPVDASSMERLLAAWREHDVTRSLHAHDRDAIRATEAARALVLELLVSEARDPRDLYTACARLGRLLADAGASPSLAASTIDGAFGALAESKVAHDATRSPAARASVVEGYFATVRESERAAARRGWEYPACAVRLDADTAAIIAGCPAEDGESLADWCGCVAAQAARDGIKQAILSGPEAARAELAEALRLVGVEIATQKASRKWLRLPWRK